MRFTLAKITDVSISPLRHGISWPPEGTNIPDKNWAMSWTKFETFESCPFKYNALYLEKSVTEDFAGEAVVWGRKVHEAAENFLRLNRPIPAEMGQFKEVWVDMKAQADRAAALVNVPPSCESKWAIDFAGRQCSYMAPEVFIRGQSDYTYVNPNQKVVTLDWKTGKGKYPKAGQLEVLALLAKGQKLFKKYTQFRGALVFLEADHMVRHDTSLASDAEHGEVLNRWQTTAMKIVECHMTNNWAQIATPLCGYCPVASCAKNTNPNI